MLAAYGRMWLAQDVRKQGKSVEAKSKTHFESVFCDWHEAKLLYLAVSAKPPYLKILALSFRKGKPRHFPQITILADKLKKFRIFRVFRG